MPHAQDGAWITWEGRACLPAFSARADDRPAAHASGKQAKARPGRDPRALWLPTGPRCRGHTRRPRRTVRTQRQGNADSAWYHEGIGILTYACLWQECTAWACSRPMTMERSCEACRFCRWETGTECIVAHAAPRVGNSGLESVCQGALGLTCEQEPALEALQAVAERGGNRDVVVEASPVGE